MDVTLDPDTANLYLILSDDGKQVTCGDTKQNLPDTLKRLHFYANVLGKQGFSSGRFYYEVQVSGKTEWDLGAVKESVNRKGEVTLTPQDGFWTVILSKGNIYTACDDTTISLYLREKPQKITSNSVSQKAPLTTNMAAEDYTSHTRTNSLSPEF